MDDPSLRATSIGCWERSLHRTSPGTRWSRTGASACLAANRTPLWAALAAKNALPQDFLDYLDAGANENSLSILTNKDQRDEQSKLRRQRALLAFIREMPGVETALVLPAEKLKPGGFLKETETRANVAVKMRGSAEMDEALAESIRKMVAMSFAGMKLKDVCVVDNHGRTFGDSSDDTGGFDR